MCVVVRRGMFGDCDVWKRATIVLHMSLSKLPTELSDTALIGSSTESQKSEVSKSSRSSRCLRRAITVKRKVGPPLEPRLSLARLPRYQKAVMKSLSSSSCISTSSSRFSAPKMPSAPASQIHLRTPPQPGKKTAHRTYIIYFLTGNPGLVEYYRTFLTHLYGVLSRDTASDRDVEFQVYSRSLSGFEMNRADIRTTKWRKDPPYGLQDQIWHSEDFLTDMVEHVKEQGAKDVRVILVGHSVGAYISLEIIRRLRAQGMAGDDFEKRVVGAVGLFPTVVDIARSESGMKAAVSTLLFQG
jgi:hypothetical protein